MQLTYDIARVIPEWAPQPGDAVATMSRRTDQSTGTFYAILAVREVRTREPLAGQRFRLSVERILPPSRPAGRVWLFWWNRR